MNGILQNISNTLGGIGGAAGGAANAVMQQLHSSGFFTPPGQQQVPTSMPQSMPANQGYAPHGSQMTPQPDFSQPQQPGSATMGALQAAQQQVKNQPIGPISFPANVNDTAGALANRQNDLTDFSNPQDQPQLIPVLSQAESVLARTQPSSQQQQQINILRQNLLDQTAYSPRVKAILQKLPISITNDPHVGGQYDPTNKTVYINPNILQTMVNTDPHMVQAGSAGRQNQGAVGVLRHEFGHVLDPYAGGNGAINSEGFYSALQHADPATQANMKNFYGNEFKIPGYQPTEQRLDTEGYAQYGAQGQNALLGNPMLRPYYAQTYTPYTPAMNYSPVYAE